MCGDTEKVELTKKNFRGKSQSNSSIRNYTLVILGTLKNKMYFFYFLQDQVNLLYILWQGW